MKIRKVTDTDGLSSQAKVIADAQTETQAPNGAINPPKTTKKIPAKFLLEGSPKDYLFGLAIFLIADTFVGYADIPPLRENASKPHYFLLAPLAFFMP